MNINELQKVWDTQNQHPLYVLKEEALYNQVLWNKKRSRSIAKITEYLYLFATFVAGTLIVGKSFMTGNHTIFKYLMASIFYSGTIYLFYQSYLRKRDERTFGKSIIEDLNHAISNSLYQVRLSYRMMYFFFPIVSLATILLKWISDGFSLETLGVILFFVLTFIAARWENSCYESKVGELETLKSKLLEEPK